MSRKTETDSPCVLASPGAATTAAPSPLDALLAGRTRPPAKAEGIAVGTLHAVENGIPFLAIPALGIERVPARSLVELDDSQIGREFALGFEAGNPHYPIVLGPMLAASVKSGEAIDCGERLLLRAEREIELRCGEAAILLAADGRVVLRGTYITSHASATQRILGGSVNIN